MSALSNRDTERLEELRIREEERVKKNEERRVGENEFIWLTQIQPTFTWLLDVIKSGIKVCTRYDTGDGYDEAIPFIGYGFSMDKKIFKELRKITLADSQEELARYGITAFEDYNIFSDNYSNYSNLSKSISFSAYENLFQDSFSEDYSQEKALDHFVRREYIIRLYEKITSFNQSNSKLNETRKFVLHITENGIISDKESVQLPRNWRKGEVYAYNSRNETASLRSEWRQLEESDSMRLSHVYLLKAIEALKYAHDHLIDWFPSQPKGNPEYIALLTRTKELTGKVMETFSETKLRLWEINEHLWE